MNKTTAKKYLSAINATRGKYLTSEALSRSMGIYPEVIDENLSFFEPIIMMDPSYNIRDLVPAIEEYIAKLEEKATVKKERITIKKEVVQQYDSIADFIYQKLTIGGLVDRSIKLSTVDLKILKKIIAEELKKRRK